MSTRIKKIFLLSVLSVIFFGSVFIVSAQEETNTETEAGSEKVFQEKTQQVVDAIPAPVKEGTQKIFTRIEQYRVNQATALEEHITKTKQEIEELQSPAPEKDVDELIEDIEEKQAGTAEKTDFGFDKPVAYIKLVALEIGHFIFHKKIVFYGITVLLVLSILRSLVNRLRRRGGYYD